MGYKTKDPEEVMKLQKEGYNVIGMSEQKQQVTRTIRGENVVMTTTIPGLVYEFNFDRPEIKQEEVKIINIETEKLKNYYDKDKKKLGRPPKRSK